MAERSWALAMVPSMTQPDDAGKPDLFASIPATAEQLLAMQRPRRPGWPEWASKNKVEQVLDFINHLDTSVLEDQQIARAIVRQLEILHQEIAVEMRADHTASAAQIAGWAVDADRLQHCRILLDSITLD